MTASLAALESEALALSPEERVLLADHLLASVSFDQEIDEAWSFEVERRVAEIESGAGQLVPVEQAIRRARQTLK